MSTNRYFVCPYCNEKFTRDDLPRHIENKHLDVLPEGFTPLQMTFHIVNHKPITYRRPCRICKKPTEWDENKGRYNFLCNNPACKQAWIKKMKENMGDKYGAYRPTSSAEGLEKMLAGRRISGKYKFRDGIEFTYTGSYEQKCLEFMDKVLEIKSEDLQVPGPVINYDYEGKKHIYIPDFYYIPYNLIIEVKDGGKNPNKKNMIETRRRQTAKEQYVINHTDYNYLRLTDNNFSQLLGVFADLKLHDIDHDTSKTIHVNENMALAGINPIVGCSPSDTIIINRGMNNVFDDPDFALSDSPKLDHIAYRDKDGILKTGDRKIIHGNYKPYIIKNSKDRILKELNKNIGQFVNKDFIFETVFGHKMYSNDQIQFESAAIPYTDYYEDLKNIEESVNNYIHESSSTKRSKEIDKLEYDTIIPIENRWGIISDNGAYNCCVKIATYRKPMRGRSSILIIRKVNGKDCVFLKYNEERKTYEAPGGGWDKGEEPIDAAVREAEEEIHVISDDVEFCGTLIEYNPNKVADWVKEHVADKHDWWYGYYSEIFVGKFKSFYRKKVDEMDQDPFIYSGEWYPIEKVMQDKYFRPEYKKALTKYITKRGGVI